MLVKTNNLSRRRILRGMLHGGAVTVALPYLGMFLNENGTALAATGQPLPERFGTWFWGLGCDPSIFNPSTVGPLTELPQQLQALEKVKQHINVYTNYDVLTDGAPNGGHFTGWVALRTGMVPAGRGLPGPTLDTAIANIIGNGTRFRSITLAATGSSRDSHSFASADAVNAPEISAVEFYRKIFGPDFQDPNSPDFTPNPRIMARKSVLSAVSEQRKELERVVGAADKARLDQHFTSIREMENRLALALEKPPPAPTCKTPSQPEELPVGRDVELVSARHRAMTDILAMALVCNQTKVFNMLYSNSGSVLTRTGEQKTHHGYTHEEAKDPALGYQPVSSWFLGETFKEWAYFVETLANTPEGDRSVLDRSVVYAYTDCQIAKIHSVDRIPMMTAGNLNGKLKTGLHIDGQRDPGTRLGYTLQRLFGVPIAGWGTASMKTSKDIGEVLA